jgi:hypothetical protein
MVTELEKMSKAECKINERARYLLDRGTVAHEIPFHLDEPREVSENRWLRLSGWCVAKNGSSFSAIRARVRKEIFEGRFDQDRPDVLKHLGIPNAPLRCGFSLKLWIPRGRARLVVEIMGADNSWHEVFSRSVRGSILAGAGQRQWCAGDANEHYDFWFDLPYDWSKKVRHLHISGWCRPLTERPSPKSVRAFAKVFPAKYGVVRPDVAATFENQSGALRSGFFSMSWCRPSLDAGTTSAARRGRWEAFFKARARPPFL